MKALILAAGRGSRMHHMTDEKPKCLVELGGKPLLAWQMSALREAGVQTIAAVTGYRAESLRGHGLTLFDNPHWSRTNMVSSLMCAQAWFDDGPVIVSYADIFYPAQVVSALLAAPADIAVAYDPKGYELWAERFENPLDDAETFRLEGERIIEIGQKPRHKDQVQGQYMGLLKITPNGWHAISAYLATLTGELVAKLDMTSLLSQLIGRGQLLQAVAVTSAWGEVDNPDDLALYETMIAQGRLHP